MRRYVEDWTEESEAAGVYDMLPYKWQEKIQTEEQKRGRWRTVVKVLLPQQQHQGLLQWINSWAMAHYGFDTMKKALMLTTEDRKMGECLKAMDRVKSTTRLLKVLAIDLQMTADEIIDFISEKMTPQHRKEAQHHDRESKQNWQRQDVRQTDADAAVTATPAKKDKTKGSGSSPDTSGGKPRTPHPEVEVHMVDAMLAEVIEVQSASQMKATLKRREPSCWGTPPLSFREYSGKYGRPGGKGGCYVCYRQHRDHQHDNKNDEVYKTEKAQYFQRNPHKVSQRDQREQRGGRDPRKHCQINADGDRYAQLMVEIQELRNQLKIGRPQGPSGLQA